MRVFAAVGRFSYRRRWLVLAGWTLLFLLGVASIPFLGGTLKGGGFSDPGSPSEKAAALIRGRLSTGFTTVEIVFTSPSLDARSSAFQQAEQNALSGISPATIRDLKQIHTYASLHDPQFISKDGHTSVAVLVFAATRYEVQAEVAHIRDALRPTVLTAYVTGEPAVNADITATSFHDLRIAESYALPVALLVLLVVFGTLVAATLPVITGAMAVTATLGALYLLGRAFDVSIFVMNVATLLGLAVGIDYALFIVARFREELAGGVTVTDAVEETVAHAGRSVFFSGLAVAIGILGLVFFPFAAMRTIGMGGALVVFFSVAAALTLLPALLGIFGPRINAVRLVRLRSGSSPFWSRWSALVLRRPAAFIILSLAVIALVGWPIVKMKMAMPTAAVLPTSSEARRGYEILKREFDMGALSPISVALTWQGDQDPLAPVRLAAFYAYGRQLASQPGVKSVTSIANLPQVRSPLLLVLFWRAAQPALAAGKPVSIGSLRLSASQMSSLRQLVDVTTAPGMVVFRVVPESDPSSALASDLVARLRQLPPPSGMQAAIAGDSAGRLDFFTGLYSRFPWVAAAVLLGTFVILVLLTHSLAVPLKAVIVNSLTILMAYGTIVFIFQFGHFERLLRFTSFGAVDAVMPIIMFCALFGVSMDYEVFLLARMHEAWHRTSDARRSVEAGLVRSGRVIVGAAALVVVIALSFAFTSISMTKTLGIGIAAAIALDAVLIRMMLVPAVMRLLGRRSWWMPGRLGGRIPDLSDEQ